jgi:hypothetical protein
MRLPESSIGWEALADELSRGATYQGNRKIRQKLEEAADAVQAAARIMAAEESEEERAHHPGTDGGWAELGTVIPAHPSRGNPPWKL